MASSLCQIIRAPSDALPTGKSVKSVFLAGTANSKPSPSSSSTDWREELSASLADQPLTIYNPYRADWDISWREDIDFAPFREQVEWELEKQALADIVVVFFQRLSQAPVSLLELGLSAHVPGKAIVVCEEGYWKRGNVQIVCRRLRIEMVETLGGVREAVLRRLPAGP